MMEAVERGKFADFIARNRVIGIPIECTDFAVMQYVVDHGMPGVKLVAQAIYHRGLPPQYQIDVDWP